MNTEMKVGDYYYDYGIFAKWLVKITKIIADGLFEFVVIFSNYENDERVGKIGTDKSNYHYVFIGDSNMELKDAINIAKGMK